MPQRSAIIDFKSPDRALSAEALARSVLDDPHQRAESGDHKDYILYCNDKRVDHWSKKIRPRSKLNLVYKKSLSPQPEVVYQDKHIIVLNKVAGLPTQKTLKSFEDNLYDQVRLLCLKAKSFPVGMTYVGLHHRLDRGTSGLVVMSRQRSINKELSDLFKNRKMQKTYLALVEKGHSLPPDRWVQKDNLARRVGGKHKFYFIVAEKGDEAITEFETVGEYEGRAYLLKCYPKTGRTHQIRVQLAHRGYAILGDWVYGDKKSAPRLMLHASDLEFHLAGQNHKFKAPSPF